MRFPEDRRNRACRYAAWYANTVTVEADTLDEAPEKAIEAANEDPAVFGAAL